MGGPVEVSGPDLGTEGLPEVELREGSPVSAQLDGAPIVVVRADGGVHALGAKCTHYGSLLSDGYCADGQIRCPSHHAAFDLATGSPVRAPALDPVPVYRTEVRDGRVFIVDEVEPPAPSPPVTQPESVVVLGAGAAGAVAAEELRRLGYGGPVTMIGDEPPVDRPNLSKDYLAGTAPEDWIPLRSPGWYADAGIDLIEARVTAIDRSARTVVLGDDRRIEYGALLIATGAEPRRLPIPGADRDHVHYLRSLADSRSIVGAVGEANHAVVVGAGFIGLEVAASLRQRGVSVTVVAPEEVPLAAIVGETLGRHVADLHAAQGVQFRLGTGVEAIEEEAVRLDDGTSLPADLVIVGIGVVPRVGLAEDAGLSVDRGILVDDSLRTDDPTIWAAGDVARFPGPDGDGVRIEHWVLAERQGQDVARSMLGLDEGGARIPFFWSQHYDTAINVVGYLGGWDRDIVSGDAATNDVMVGYARNGEVTAVATIGRDVENLAAERALETADQAALRSLLGI